MGPGRWRSSDFHAAARRNHGRISAWNRRVGGGDRRARYFHAWAMEITGACVTGGRASPEIVNARIVPIGARVEIMETRMISMG